MTDNNNQLPDLGLEIGDEVEAFGLRGRVESIDHTKGYPFKIYFYDVSSEFECFDKQGRLFSWHRTPSLKLIAKKAKKKILRRALLKCVEETEPYFIETIRYFSSKPPRIEGCGWEFFCWLPGGMDEDGNPVEDLK